jgi:hypothetical protein
MESEKRFFKQGDFVTYDNKPGSFVIFEGIDNSTSNYKKLSVIVNYDPSKYRQHDDGTYRSSPFLEVATKNTRCEKTLDEDKETYWVRLCTPTEKAKALKTLEEYGYVWNEELLAIVDKNTGEIIRKVVAPKVEYHGEIIRPITKKFKKLLRMFCIETNKKKYSYQNSGYPYGRYPAWDGYDDEYGYGYYD